MISFILLAQLPQPIQRVGSCPIGYYISAGYCVPSRTAKPAIVKEGSTCPLGYYSTGSYCKQTR
jgi:hypothetical protein